MKTPFKTLQENIDKLTFDCEKKYINDYKSCLDAVLGRIDIFFVSNNLYETANYQKIVDEILKTNKLSFKVADLSLFSRAGQFLPMPSGKREIAISQDFFGKGKITEGILCHEFLHYITLGPSKIEYKKDGKTFEVTPPYHSSLYFQAGSLKNLTEDTYLPLKSSLDGGFICEAMTENLKQQIYPDKDVTKHYLPQTTLFKYLTKIVGEEKGTKDFLRCDMPTFSTLLGKKNFAKFEKACSNFQKKFDLNEKINFYNDKDYKIAHTLATCSILKDIGLNPKNYSPKDVLRIISTIKTETPFRKIQQNYVEKHFEKSINKAYMKYVQNLPLDETSRAEFDNLFRRTLDLQVKQNDKIYDLPFASHFLLKEEEKGYAILCDGVEVNSANMPRIGTDLSIFLKNKHLQISNDNGVYNLSTTNTKTNEKDFIDVLESDSKTRFTIRNAQSSCKISFKEMEKNREKEILQNQSKLSCFCPWAKDEAKLAKVASQDNNKNKKISNAIELSNDKTIPQPQQKEPILLEKDEINM